MIRTLIVDDEPLARQHVRRLLERHSNFEIAGEAAHGGEAVTQIEALRPDLVFLDIQMPGADGFEVIEAVGAEAMPPTVFVTAYDAFAVRAFEVQALDYLLKPFDDLRFDRVIERAGKRIGEDRSGPMRDMLGQVGRAAPLVARAQGTAHLIRLEEIDWIAAAGDYAEVRAQSRTHLINESLASLEARLPAGDFARIHRSLIVRLDRVSEIRSGTHGDGTVRLSCGAELRYSRRFRQAIDSYLQP